MFGTAAVGAVHTSCRFLRIAARSYAVGVVLPGLVTPLVGAIL
ncbi:hypothetical protein [Loktanella sp. IMCC34160]|nr:hypothetical protein [Loktanella sp. IMCC34160]